MWCVCSSVCMCGMYLCMLVYLSFCVMHVCVFISVYVWCVCGGCVYVVCMCVYGWWVSASMHLCGVCICVCGVCVHLWVCGVYVGCVCIVWVWCVHLCVWYVCVCVMCVCVCVVCVSVHLCAPVCLFVGGASSLPSSLSALLECLPDGYNNLWISPPVSQLFLDNLFLGPQSAESPSWAQSSSCQCFHLHPFCYSVPSLWRFI